MAILWTHCKRQCSTTSAATVSASQTAILYNTFHWRRPNTEVPRRLDIAFYSTLPPSARGVPSHLVQDPCRKETEEKQPKWATRKAGRDIELVRPALVTTAAATAAAATFATSSAASAASTARLRLYSF